MPEHCMHEQDWGELKKMVHDMDKEIYGNGRPGLAQRVVELSGKINSMSTDIRDLSTNVSALLKFMSGAEGRDTYRDKEGAAGRQKTQIYISAILGTAGIIIALISKYG